MKNLSDHFYQRIKKLNQEVKQDLHKKGLVVPKQNQDGTITIGKFVIKKDARGNFMIINQHREIVAEKINLPYTAVLVANKLALGRWLDRDLLNIDVKYGYAEFDEIIHRHSANKYLKSKSYERAEIMLAKSNKAHYKKNYYKKLIKSDFTKLLSVR